MCCARWNPQPQNLHPELSTTVQNNNFQCYQLNRWWQGVTNSGNLKNHLNSLKLDIVYNSNIGKGCLGRKGLHLIERRYDKPAINVINKTKNLWLLSDSFHAKNLVSPVTVSPSYANRSVFQHLKLFFKRFQRTMWNPKLGDSPSELLHHLKLRNTNRLDIDPLNISSLCNKSDTLQLIVKNMITIF